MSVFYFCGKCHNKYATRQNWANHFGLKKVKSRIPGITARVTNICYNTNDPKVCENDLEKAKKNFEELVKQRKVSKVIFAANKPSTSTKFSVATEDSPKKTKDDSQVSKKRKIEESEEEVQEDSLQLPTQQPEDINNNIQVLQPAHNSKYDAIEEKLSTLLQETHINNQLLKEVHSQIVSKKTCSKIPIAVPSKKTTVVPAVIKLTKEEESNKLITNLAALMAAKSVKQLLQNPLVEKSFKLIDITEEQNTPQTELPEVVERTLASEEIIIVEETKEDLEDINPDEEHESKYELFCICCSHVNTNTNVKNQHRGAFGVKNPEYSCQMNEKQARWFLNLKQSVKRHIVMLRHQQRLASFEVINNYNLNSKQQVEKICSNLLYYMITTNSPASMYPVILAVMFRSGYQVGNYNHSRYSYVKMLDFIDNQLKEQSKAWFKKQTSVSVTADIGTVRGITLLVVLLLSEVDDKTVFVGMNPVSSKAGAYCADQILDILKSSKYLELEEQELKNKISGLVCDGAFVKGNKPFKNRMKHHLGDDLHFRWDPLHMMNRAHLAALEKQKMNFNLNTLMDYIQCHSKQFRSGLEYTQLQLDQMFSFKRPKLKSDTRLVNFDYDQVIRFLENQIWFDHPTDVLYTARIYVLIAYVTKMILGVSQKTDVSTEFIRSVYYDKLGKSAMIKVLDMGLKIINNEPICDVIKENLPESTDEKKFDNVKDYLLNEVCKLLKTKGSEIMPPPESEIEGRTRAETSFNSNEAKEIILKYIDDLWDQIEDRLFEDTDGTTRWSEAPSESIFSTLEYVVENKPSLKYCHSVSLCRIVKEAPPPGTAAASQITVTALENWKNESVDKRSGNFTTNKWMVGTMSTTVAKAYNNEPTLPKPK